MTETAGAGAVEQLRAQAIKELEAAGSIEEVERWRVGYLGRSGKVTQVLRGLGGLSPEERRSVGAAANQVKAALEEALAAREKAVRETELVSRVERERIDVTLPGWPVPHGGLHPTTRMLREICEAFRGMGFAVEEGPEIEWDRYNFDALNIPKDHPARDMWDTLWIDHTDEAGYRPMLLRTHTSPMQARIMEKQQPPIRVVIPGKCYRYEATDATHEWHFYQIEGLVVDKGVTFADLKGTLFEFARRIFGEDRQVRFRCDYFPFVEPGVDMAISNFKVNGVRPIKRDQDWLEIMGAGMVHPNVLRGVGYDPEVYTGFAFGMGVERIAMLKYGIDDIRHFYSNDMRFLKQF
ncbi:MAG: phenylalanine--tRNA ligase subunit alpha [SAR202 cluster bacterium]|nr:phenylalanine--tRNA ligase subunit alpha [SAR202 cluster bacterium]